MADQLLFRFDVERQRAEAPDLALNRCACFFMFSTIGPQRFFVSRAARLLPPSKTRGFASRVAVFPAQPMMTSFSFVSRRERSRGFPLLRVVQYKMSLNGGSVSNTR